MGRACQGSVHNVVFSRLEIRRQEDSGNHVLAINCAVGSQYLYTDDLSQPKGRKLFKYTPDLDL